MPMYSVFGPGELARPALKANLEDLRAAAAAADEEFWFGFAFSDALTPTTREVLEWAAAEGIYYDIFRTEAVELPDYLAEGANSVTESDDPVAALAAHIEDVGEDDAKALLLFETPEEDDPSDADGEAVDAALAIPFTQYLELNNNCAPINIGPEEEGAEEPQDSAEDADSVEDPEPTPDVPDRRQELEKLQLKQLRATSLQKEYGFRSSGMDRDAIIDRIIGIEEGTIDPGPIAADPEPEAAPAAVEPDPNPEPAEEPAKAKRTKSNASTVSAAALDKGINLDDLADKVAERLFARFASALGGN